MFTEDVCSKSKAGALDKILSGKKANILCNIAPAEFYDVYWKRGAFDLSFFL
jgi:hypothetical protein